MRKNGVYTPEQNKERSGRIFETKRDARIVLFSVIAWVVALVVVWGVSFGGFQRIASNFDSSDGRLPANAQPGTAEVTQVGDDEMVVSIAPDPRLVDGMLRVNFVVLDLEGASAERLQIEQDAKVVYRSGVVQPGNRLEWVSAPDAKPGAAIAVVNVVDEEGNDYGTPTMVEIKVREG